MTEAELLQILARGEDSGHQFKRDETNANSVAAELAAFANSGGGRLFLGVEDDGVLRGLDAGDIRRLNQLLSNAASQHVRPPLHPISENVQTAQGLVMVVTVPDGLAKPYVDNQGRIWVKNGSDKRHVTAREELQRMFQQSGLVYADVVPVTGSSVADIDAKAFNGYFNRRYGQTEHTGQPLAQTLQNLGLAEGQELNLAGLLLFGQRPQRYRPAFEVKAVAFPGPALHDTRYLDSEDIGGALPEQFLRSFAFLRRNLRHIQGDRGFNTLGRLEVPEQAIEELLVNALIHRDYFTSASIRLMVFTDRIEIISPGHLPDSLSTEAIRHGAANRRNPTLTEHAVHLLPYRGLGTGIPRALHDWPGIELIDDVAGNQFKVVIPRPQPHLQTVGPVGIGPPESQLESRPESQPESLELRVLRLLRDAPAGKAEISRRLGQKDVSGQLNKIMRELLADGAVAYTLPDKPNSRLQQYRITDRGLTRMRNEEKDHD